MRPVARSIAWFLKASTSTAVGASRRHTMPSESLLKRYAAVTAASIMLAVLSTTASAQTPPLPAYMEPISGLATSTRAETATKNVLALNTMMFELYGDAAQVFKRNILAKHPVILGLFSGAGGRFVLYRPGQA